VTAGRARRLLAGLALAAAAPAAAGQAAAGQEAPVAAPAGRSHAGTLPGGARWAAEVPARWNGTLLLWSRGYAPVAGPPELAPDAVRRALLARGYAIAASDYGAGGWALAEAVPAQRATVAAFRAREPGTRRVIGFGYSMGGLVTAALAEEPRQAIAGAAAFCPSIGGALGMMNMALDGAFALETLAASDAGLRLVRTGDDRANGARVAAAVAAAWATPAGRARLALAGVLGGLPGWTTPGGPEPAPGDADAQAAEMASVIAMGLFLPRADQEARAGGVFSWNTGVDYAAQLRASGREPLVRTLYRRAGLDLAADLARLAAAPRVAADPAAVAYMAQHYTPTMRPAVPIVSVQAMGDGLTSPSLQGEYVRQAGQRAAGLWLRQAGHCTFAPAQVTAAIGFLERRLDAGRWPARPAGFVAYAPPPMLRPCRRGGACR
jgi:pimeloyl-ACP methyl ester carboxylesterase